MDFLVLGQNQRPSTSTSEGDKKKSTPTSDDLKDDDSLKEGTEQKEDSCQQSASLLLLPSDSTVNSIHKFLCSPELYVMQEDFFCELYNVV